MTHRFELLKETPGVLYQVFLVESVPKTNFSIDIGGSKVETKQDFRQELYGDFTFETQTTADRMRKRIENIKFPPILAPQSGLKVSVILHEITVKAPFSATFTQGTNTWSENGVYTGVDASNLKLKTEDLMENGVC